MFKGESKKLNQNRIFDNEYDDFSEEKRFSKSANNNPKRKKLHRNPSIARTLIKKPSKSNFTFDNYKKRNSRKMKSNQDDDEYSYDEDNEEFGITKTQPVHKLSSKESSRKSSIPKKNEKSSKRNDSPIVKSKYKPKIRMYENDVLAEIGIFFSDDETDLQITRSTRQSRKKDSKRSSENLVETQKQNVRKRSVTKAIKSSQNLNGSIGQKQRRKSPKSKISIQTNEINKEENNKFIKKLVNKSIQVDIIKTDNFDDDRIKPEM